MRENERERTKDVRRECVFAFVNKRGIREEK